MLTTVQDPLLEQTDERPVIGHPEVAYIIKAFPRTSETFIANEIELLEVLGLQLEIFSIKKLPDQKLHGSVGRIAGVVRYVPEAEPVNEGPFLRWLVTTLPRFAHSHWAVFCKRPLSYASALALALSMCVRYRASAFRLKKVFVKEFLQAGYIANSVLERTSIRHLHAHFCHGSTTIAMFASCISGLPFSFTAHAKDIYVKDLNPGDLLRKKLARAKFAVTCTDANRIHLDKIRPEDAQLKTIYHGLDLSLFTPVTPKAKGVVPVILSVGRFVEKKGFVFLVDACSLLRDRGYRFECEIVGGKDTHFEVVRKRIEELKLDDVIRLRPAVTQEELKGIYERATLFALPCLVSDNGDRDGIPNVLVEAMAMQIPVVSTRISGIPELIEPDINGFLVSEKSAPELADAMAVLLEDVLLRRQFGLQGRKKVMQLFDARENTAILLQLFRDCVKPERSAA